MTPEQLIAVIGAFTALVIALGRVWSQVQVNTKKIDGRIDQLVGMFNAHAREHLKTERARARRAALTRPKRRALKS